MKIVSLNISNFRSIKKAELRFDGHSLILGPNNIGKSTICEAIDLVLGPDRLSRFPPIEEFDFYNAKYLSEAKAEGEDPEPIPLRIELILVGLSEEVESRCRQHMEFWSAEKGRLLSPGELAQANPPLSEKCLRLETIGRYARNPGH